MVFVPFLSLFFLASDPPFKQAKATREVAENSGFFDYFGDPIKVLDMAQSGFREQVRAMREMQAAPPAGDLQLAKP
jgi:hypothetical protein